MRKFHDFPLKRISRLPLYGVIKEYYEVESIAEQIELLKELDNQGKDYIVIGSASNILFASSEIKTIVVKPTYRFLYINPSQLIISGSYSTPRLGQEMATKNISNFLGVETIPGTIGAGIKNNSSFLNYDYFAGLTEVLIYHDGETKLINAEAIKREYRHTDLDSLVLIAFYRPVKNFNELEETRKKLFEYRERNQIVSGYTLGSTFKNSESYKAYRLVAGVKDQIEVNHIYFSDQHSNFLIVDSMVKPEEIVQYLDQIESMINAKYHIKLEKEVKLVY